MSADALAPRLTTYVPHVPHPPQQAFLLLSDIGVREVLYGGAAGGGKSDALLMAALQYVDVPGYAALLLRRTFRDLDQPDALIPRSKEWLAGTDATWNGNDYRWTFPNGATITFGYLQHEDDKLQYQGAAFQMIGFDELTQFTETQYTYLFSRCRRPRVCSREGHEDAGLVYVDGRPVSSCCGEDVPPAALVPLRVRSASNPGGPGHEWVKQRFGLYRTEDDPDGPMVCRRPEWREERVFIPAKLSDNPSLDRSTYEQMLAELDSTTRRQLLDGDWDVREPGSLFRREWFEIIEQAPSGCRWVRHWDLAATEPTKANPDPDWTAGLRLGRHPSGSWVIQSVVRCRKRPEGVEETIKQAAAEDGRAVTISIEQEPGSSGKSTIAHYQRSVLDAYEVKGLRSTGSKEERARPISAKAEAGLVKVVRGPWLPAFLDEVESFPGDAHDDQVDALSGAFIQLMALPKVTRETYIESDEEPVVQRGDLTLVGDQYIDKE